MESIASQILILVIFLTAVFLNMVKKNTVAIFMYSVQSLAITGILFYSYLEKRTLLLLTVVILTLLVKSVIAPLFFSKLVKKHKLKFSANTYLNMSFTLIIITAIAVISHSSAFNPLTSLIKGNGELLASAVSVILISFFLIINRKGAISQMIGVLSLENGVVSFAIFSGLEQSPGLQIGIIFDIFIWMMVANIFISMIYRQFGSLESTDMKLLKD